MVYKIVCFVNSKSLPWVEDEEPFDTLDEAQATKDSYELMQPENRYEIEEVE